MYIQTKKEKEKEKRQQPQQHAHTNIVEEKLVTLAFLSKYFCPPFLPNLGRLCFGGPEKKTLKPYQNLFPFSLLTKQPQTSFSLLHFSYSL